ncbi:MAG: hypothetical protein ACKO5L_02210, partial [Bacteroidota bacterium]
QPKNDPTEVGANGQPKNEINQDREELAALATRDQNLDGFKEIALLEQQVLQTERILELRKSMTSDQFSLVLSSQELKEITQFMEGGQAAYNARNPAANMQLGSLTVLRASIESVGVSKQQETPKFEERSASPEQVTILAQKGAYDTYVSLRKEFVQLDEQQKALQDKLNNLKIQFFRPSDSISHQQQLIAITSITSEITEILKQKSLKQNQMELMEDHELFAGMITEGVLPERRNMERNLAAMNKPEDLVFKMEQGNKGQNNQYPISQDLPSGLVYRVQVGAFKNKVPDYFFREFTPVSGEVLNNGLTAYLAGFFERAEAAMTARNGIRLLG